MKQITFFNQFHPLVVIGTIVAVAGIVIGAVLFVKSSSLSSNDTQRIVENEANLENDTTTDLSDNQASDSTEQTNPTQDTNNPVATGSPIQGDTPNQNIPSKTPTPAPAESTKPAPKVLVNTKWQWVQTKMADGTTHTPNSSKPFIITIPNAPTISMQTDCNSGGAEFQLKANNGIEFAKITSTLMYCEGSQEQLFFDQISQTISYKIEGQNLFFNLAGNSGTMTFVYVGQ